MRERAKGRVCVALVVALALPATSPLREISRRSSLCPQDLDVVIETVLHGGKTPTRPTTDSVGVLRFNPLKVLAEHGVLPDDALDLALTPDTHAPALPPPPPSLALHPEGQGSRPHHKASEAPPPVRGPPSHQV